MLRSNLRPQLLHRSFHTSRSTFAESAKQVPTKGSDTASKTAVNAQEYANKALEQSQKLAKIIGNMSGKLLQNAGPRVTGVVDRLVGLQKPVVYWGKVTGEVAKQGILSIDSFR